MILTDDLRRWMRAVKSFVARRFPRLAFAYLEVQDLWTSRGSTVGRTPAGFLLMGSAEMRSGAFEESEVGFVRSELAHCDVLVDVGANIGLYTCLARQMGKDAVAVEPEPRNCKLLLNNLVMNGWTDTEVLPVALGQRPGIANLFGAGTGASVVNGWAGAHAVQHRAVAMSTLDRILGDRFSGKKLLIKVDVEGGEYDLLLGATMTLSSTPAPIWLVEVCLQEHHPEGINPHFVDIFHMFWEQGYKAHTLDVPARAIEARDVDAWFASCKRSFGSHNVVFRKG